MTNQSTWPLAEQATVAAAVMNPGFRAMVLDAGADVFSYDTSRRAWQVLKSLTESGHPIDLAALEVALGEPLGASPSTDYWPVLLEKRLERQLAQIGRWLLKPHDGASATAVAARVLGSLNQALTATQQSAILSAAETAQAGLHALSVGQPQLLASGVPKWDAAAAGWGPEDLVLLAARPSQGKTALGVQWTWQTAATGRGVAFCSVEMGPPAIGMRALGQYLAWSSDELRSRLSDPAVNQAVTDLARWPWHVVDASGASVADLQAAVARADLMGPRCEVIVVDYLQLLRPTGRASSREQEISRIGTELKNWARRDKRLVVALSQMSRKVEERADRMPTLADLRESGALEQAADGVVFIHHPDESDAAHLIIAKNRNGPTGSVPVRWHASTMRFLPRGFV